MNLAELSYAAGWQVVRRLPTPVSAPLFDAGAALAARRGGRGVRRLAANLRRGGGPDLPAAELDALVRRGMRSYLRYYREAFRLPAMSRAEVLDAFRLSPLGVLADAVAAGRGVVIALPHSGNWDLAGAWVAANGWPIVTVVERLTPESLYRRFLTYRQSLGMEILPLTGASTSVLRTLADRLGKGYVVPLLADRDLPGRGVAVDFFGARATMPPGPALLALRSGAPLYVAELWYTARHAHAHLHGPVPVPDVEAGAFGERVRVLTQRIADLFAEGIARHPEDWHMLQRVWRDDGFESRDGG